MYLRVICSDTALVAAAASSPFVASLSFSRGRFRQLFVVAVIIVIVSVVVVVVIVIHRHYMRAGVLPIENKLTDSMHAEMCDVCCTEYHFEKKKLHEPIRCPLLHGECELRSMRFSPTFVHGRYTKEKHNKTKLAFSLSHTHTIHMITVTLTTIQK